MKYKKIIYFVTNGFSKRDYERYGLENFYNRGYSIEVWNFSTFMFKKISFESSYSSLTFKLKDINTKKDFIFLSKTLTEDVFVINLLFLNVKTYFIYKKLKYNNIKFCETSLGSIPYCSDSAVKKKISFLKIYNFLFNVDISPIFYIVDGEKNAKLFNNQKILYAHSRDYDLFLKSKNNLKKCISDSIVFLDVNLVEHSDFKLLDIRNKVTKKNYYSALKKYFYELKKVTGKNIVIAAHPRSDYFELKKIFRDFTVIQNNTLEVVYQSSLIVSHDTTAISFVVLLNKPIQFITTTELRNSGDKNTECMANYFNKNVINIDDKFSFNKDKAYQINIEKYNQYIRDYIKVDTSPDKLLWDICIDRIEKS